jgi:threonine synthase
VVIEGKLEVYGPTGSHKDRECALIIASAIKGGHTSVGCSSTGNLARALSFACKTVGLGCHVWLSSDAEAEVIDELEQGEVRVHLVDGGYAQAVQVGNAAMARDHIFNGNPSQCIEKIRASEALGREILAHTDATHVVCATNNGSLALGLLRAVRRASHPVKLIAVTCPDTAIAHSIAGAHGLEEEWRRERDAPDCQVVAVDDAEIQCWEAWLNLKGLPLQPSSAATLAALYKLGLVVGDRVVCVLSGLRIGAVIPEYTEQHRREKVSTWS